MSDSQSVTLHAKQHDKLGILHIGVTREGFVAVAGDTADIDDQQEIIFDKTHVKVSRKGGDYTFSNQLHC